MANRKFRVSSLLASAALGMAFYLAAFADQAEAFVVVAPIVVGGKWLENSVERWREPKE